MMKRKVITFETVLMAVLLVVNVVMGYITVDKAKQVYIERKPSVTNSAPVRAVVGNQDNDQVKSIRQILDETNPDNVFHNVGVYRTTGYCPCDICCGSWAYDRPLDDDGKPIIFTASGERAVAGYTCASNSFDFGTKLLINGHVYVVTDRTAENITNTVDIYYNTHGEALAHGCQYYDVFVINDVRGG